MQPDAQTTTRGSLVVSASSLEIAIVVQGALVDSTFLPLDYKAKDKKRGSKIVTYYTHV